MLSELAIPHIRCCLSAIPSDLKKSTVVDESLFSMNQQFCSRENHLLQLPFFFSDVGFWQFGLITVIGVHIFDLGVVLHTICFYDGSSHPENCKCV